LYQEFDKKTVTLIINIHNMTAIELKKILVKKISEIDDVSFLKAIKTILDTKSGSRTLILTDEQRSEIIESQKEIKKGYFIEQEELDNEFLKWLNER
jgi:hypothetical protein